MILSIFRELGHVFFLYQLLLAGGCVTLSLAASISSSATAFTNSSDAWASLVANIAPLLILIGEKHVKAYFKTMSHHSHFILYAVSPIGLVTAIVGFTLILITPITYNKQTNTVQVTLIRLNGNDFTKRIIGRQFETQAEILADVTSVSYGDVGLKLRSDGKRRTVETAVDSSEDDSALLGIYMSTSATGLELLDEMQKRLNLFSCFDRSTRNGEDWEIEWQSINVVRVNGSDAQKRCRRLAWQRTKIESLALISHIIGDANLEKRLVLGRLLSSFDIPAPLSLDITTYLHSFIPPLSSQGLDHSAITKYTDECQFFNTTFLKGPGVSPVLTATESLNQVSRVWLSQRFIRYSASFLCLSFNVGIIITSGFLGESVVTLSLITAGIAGSFASSWITAMFIHRATDISYISLSGLQVLCAGYFSNSELDGIGLTYSPSVIAVSTASQYLCHIWTLVSTVSISAASFCILYLGLRAAQWWVPLAILANVAFTTCMRAVLGYEINVDPSRSELASRFSRYRRKAVLHHLLAEKHGNDEHYSKRTSIAKSCYGHESYLDLSKGEVDERGTWAILSFAGLANSCPSSYAPIAQDLNIAEKVEKTLLYNAYNISLWLYKQNLAPAGISRYKSQRASYLTSEFLASEGIWYQPFEVLLPLSSEDTDLVLDEDRVPDLLRMWATESLTGNHEIAYRRVLSPYLDDSTQAITASKLLDEYFCHEVDIMGLQEVVRETARMLAAAEDPPRSSWTTIWSNKVMLWMAIKFIFASWPSWMGPEEFASILKQRRDRVNPLRSSWMESEESPNVFRQPLDRTNPLISEDSSLKDNDIVIHCLSPAGTLRLEIEEMVPSYVGCLVNRGIVAPNTDS